MGTSISAMSRSGNYCKRNRKILYDFADIESYNPDGEYLTRLQMIIVIMTVTGMAAGTGTGQLNGKIPTLSIQTGTTVILHILNL